jgi:hypothetical protein
MPQDLMVGVKTADVKTIADGENEGRTLRRAKRTRVALGAAFAALVLCANYSAARAGDDDNESPTDKFLRTLGLRDLGSTQYEINYSERSPLVVPPTRDLPPPVTSSVAPAPDWPKDPDVLRQRDAKKPAEDKVVIRQGDSVIEDERALRPDELNVGRATPTVTAPGVGEQSSPSQLGEPKRSFFSFDWLKKEEYGTFTGEPPRVSLTDPPPGYQTPSPDQPYGITPEKKTYKPATLGERMEMPR